MLVPRRVPTNVEQTPCSNPSKKKLNKTNASQKKIMTVEWYMIFHPLMKRKKKTSPYTKKPGTDSQRLPNFHHPSLHRKGHRLGLRCLGLRSILLITHGDGGEAPGGFCWIQNERVELEECGMSEFRFSKKYPGPLISEMLRRENVRKFLVPKLRSKR